jgi:hypothetical protein
MVKSRGWFWKCIFDAARAVFNGKARELLV